jgi:hypothetical protein
MKGINKNSPFKNFAFSNGIYYTPLAPSYKRIFAVTNNKEHNGYKYDVVGVFDIDKLPKDVQDAIPVLQKKVEMSRYNKKLNNLKKKFDQLSKKF